MYPRRKVVLVNKKAADLKFVINACFGLVALTAYWVTHHIPQIQGLAPIFIFSGACFSVGAVAAYLDGQPVKRR